MALLLQQGGALGPVLQVMQCGAWLFGLGAVGTVCAFAACAVETASVTMSRDKAAIMMIFCVCIFYCSPLKRQDDSITLL
jgi:hypothetical protein